MIVKINSRAKFRIAFVSKEKRFHFSHTAPQSLPPNETALFRLSNRIFESCYPRKESVYCTCITFFSIESFEPYGRMIERSAKRGDPGYALYRPR